MGRLGDPEDMVEAALYLASPGAAYTTGITIFVDGGIMLP
jgi:NAD(P)-dependent dehydrogenase (short-subunit alcohol dehydrogenase family)